MAVCALALACRVVFLVFVASSYFGRANVHVDGDTLAYLEPVMNLVDHSTYTVAPENPRGLFGRMPGYPFFIGVPYFLTGRSEAFAFPLVAWVQIGLDVLACFLLFQTAEKWLPRTRAPIILSSLYATYPFVIVWTPVVYAEALSIFLMVLTLFLATRGRPFASGVAIGAGALVRPQLLLLLPFIPLLPSTGVGDNGALARRVGTYLLGFGLVFAPWPVRNWLHGSLLLTQDVSALPHYSADVQAARAYWYTVSSGQEGEFEKLLRGGRFIWPGANDQAPRHLEERARAVELARRCGTGFAAWERRPPPLENCDAQIASAFLRLREEEQQRGPVNYYVWIPMENLGKALFKRHLVNAESVARRIASNLFTYRTVLVVLGFAGAFAMLGTGEPILWRVGVFVLGFAAAWYGLLCAGPPTMFRNVEIRYLLPADVLLLIPAAYLLSRLPVGSKRRTTLAPS